MCFVLLADSFYSLDIIRINFIERLEQFEPYVNQPIPDNVYYGTEEKRHIQCFSYKIFGLSQYWYA
jgi:hypothetical protein